MRKFEPGDVVRCVRVYEWAKDTRVVPLFGLVTVASTGTNDLGGFFRSTSTGNVPFDLGDFEKVGTIGEFKALAQYVTTGIAAGEILGGYDDEA